MGPKLIVCGTGPMEEWCKKFVDKNDCNVELKGFVSNNDVREIISKSRALILPTQWYEGFPMSIIEAYSVGTPVICSDIGNAGSVVENCITGFKFRTSQELMECINYINENDLSASVTKCFNDLYSKEKNYILLDSIYCSILKECEKQ